MAWEKQYPISLQNMNFLSETQTRRSVTCTDPSTVQIFTLPMCRHFPDSEGYCFQCRVHASASYAACYRRPGLVHGEGSCASLMHMH